MATGRLNCTLGEAIYRPLFNPHKSAPNPCFLASGLLLIQAPFAIVTLYQLILLLFRNSYGPFKLKYSFGNPWSVKSVGIVHFWKVLSAVLQGLVTLLLASLSSGNSPVDSISESVIPQAALAAAAVAFLLVLPLHILESTRSVVGHGSLLFFWFFSSISWLIILINDWWSPYKVFVQPHAGKDVLSSVITGEVFLLANSIFVFVLENSYYSPSKELIEYFDLNGWEPSTVRNLVQLLLFTWVNPMLKDVYHTNNIEVEEVPSAEIELQSDVISEVFRKAWAKEIKRATWWRDRRVRNAKEPTEEDKKVKPSLLLVVGKMYWITSLQGIGFQLGEIISNTSVPFLLQAFIKYFTNYVTAKEAGKETPPLIIGFVLSFSIYGASVLRYFSFNQLFMSFFRISFGVQSSLTTMSYEKALKLSPDARREKNTGEIVNHVSVDVGVIARCLEVVSDAVVIPIRLALCLGALWKLLGNSTWAGLAVALIMVPLSSMVSMAIFSLFKIQMECKDERTRLTSEILNSIKSIKLYSWEKPMLKRLDEVRNKKELKNAKQMGIWNAGADFVWECIPFLISCAVYGFFGFFSESPLTPAIIFPALSLFDQLSDPIQMIPGIFSQVAEAKVSLNRLQDYFIMDEMEEGVIERTNKPLKKGDESVRISNASFVWSQKAADKTDGEPTYALKNINFKARKGELTCVVGRVGSGKTTLLKSIVGEIPKLHTDNSSVSVNGTVAYCAQNAWILNSSVRENIIFGKRFDRDFYDKTIEACQLKHDFEVLPHGDSTLVGEKGISLSGGQKARLSLARAVYSRADIYLLDDVLSAVDAHVGKRITNAVLSSDGMLASKTIILATNSVKILKIAQDIYYLKQGEVIEHGTHESLVEKQGDVAKLIAEFADQNDHSTDAEDTARESSTESSEDEEPKPFQPTALREVEDLGDDAHIPLVKVSSQQTIGRASVVSFDHKYQFEEDFGKTQKDDENKEKTEKGKIKLDVYIQYIKACRYPIIIVWSILSVVIAVTEIYGRVVLKIWSEKNFEHGSNVKPSLYLTLYASTGVLGGIINFVNSYIIWTFSAIHCSKYFHDRMAKSVLRAPMSFFDTTPIGRILNRFSDDISVLDNQMLWISIVLFHSIMETLIRVGIVVYNLPVMILVIPVLVIIFIRYRNWFIPASRELKRLRSALRSPVFSHLQESINGAETLRAYNENERFIHANKRKVDNVIKVDFVAQNTNRWLSMRLQSIAALVVLAASLSTLLSLVSKKPFSPAMIGFLMTYVFSSTMFLNAIIRMWSEVEVRLVSIERLIEYGNLPSEAPEVIEEKRPQETWPDNGSVEFKGYSTSYRPGLPPVLKNINLEIKPSEKIGIVGRTGAGKSSLTLALFRIIEATEGNINIDSIDTSQIGLHDLRGQLNIIPQDAHAFEGTVRQNLDPFDQYTDEELWKVLDLAHLKTHVESMKSEVKEDKDKKDTKKDAKDEEPQVGLKANVLEGGSNLSSGQKQLLCLARALLKKSKVLVLDEATAAVDVQTDKIIQETIRSEFNDKTIFTIAHRLDTILDSDRILVLDKGEVKEFDTPDKLLSDKNSEFYSLCKEGGYLSKIEKEKN
ncbi:hypothetical protein FT663_00912 [Candidozyma haemuli var. vulneris]|nr:hypothetical protein FT662_00716 [[Candida] haemuloni var. vulneris]KAF3994938.1 hypothetical protein FT663_00912 [[Candida] haemuloni var. vulneris]